MPPLYRILEVGLYSILNFLPYLILALYPFKKHLRFSLPTTSVLVGLITIIQIVLGVLAAFTDINSGILSAASTTIYAVFYFIATKSQFGKTLFTLLMLSNLANLVVMASKCLEGLVFGAIAYESYRWSHSLCMTIVHCLFTIPVFFYFGKYYASGINKQAGAATWNYLWLVPATFYLLWFYHIYGSPLSSLEIALLPGHTVFLFFINLGGFLIYHMVIRLINEQDKISSLKEQNYQLTMQNLQYENLRSRINEARQAKHDIRHHVHVMSEYLRDGKLDELEKYLRNYRDSLPNDSTIMFCKHYATNALLLYYDQQAKSNNIDFTVSVAVPEQFGIPDNVLTVVLGNLLENALDACLTVTDQPPVISVKGKTDSHSIFFQIKNTYNNVLLKNRDNLYQSTKNKDRGIGLSSVRNIAEQYGGIFEISQDKNMFLASVMLNIPNND